MNLVLITIIIYVLRTVYTGFPNIYPKLKQENVPNDSGEAVFVTPLLETNRLDEAKRASEVHFSGFLAVKSYSGYFTVNKKHNSNMFFWFFPSTDDYKNDPVVLWLQGGPGMTSLYGLFTELGPFQIVNKQNVTLRNYTWNKNHSLLFIDNPVGTGYSFTESGYCQNETQIGLDLYSALLQFFVLFPELQKNEFFITGESYAGKYVPAISYTIYKKNPTASLKINLKGLAIGNGLSDPINQLNYGDYLYQLGLIDVNEKRIFKQYEKKTIEFIEAKDYLNAFKMFSIIIMGDFVNSTLVRSFTGFKKYYNFLKADYPNKESIYLSGFIQRSDVRKAIHVGSHVFHTSDTVEKYLISDIMQSVAPWISELLNHYRVLIYSGQLDIIVAYPLSLNYLQKLNFSGAEIYKVAQRHKWFVDKELAGYVKEAGNLTEVLVRNAGHMVPTDQPKFAYNLISKFIRRQSLY